MKSPADDLEAQGFAAGQGILTAAKLGDPQLALKACQDARAVYEAGAPEFVLLMRLPFYESGDTVIEMRSPCRACGVGKGLLRKKGTQDTVWCAACGGYAYNAPRREVGT